MSDRLFPTDRDQSWVDPRPRPEPGLLRLLREVYPDPSPYQSVEQFTRFVHDDVRQLDDDAIAGERLLAYLRRALEPTPGAWLVKRITCLDAEAARRKGKGRRR